MARARSALVMIAAIALAVGAVSCGDDDDGEDTTTSSAIAVPDGSLDPAVVEAKLTEVLLQNEDFADSSPVVDCPDEPAETLTCDVTGAEGVSGSITAKPYEAPGFAEGSFEYEGPVTSSAGVSTEFTGFQSP